MLLSNLSPQLVTLCWQCFVRSAVTGSLSLAVWLRPRLPQGRPDGQRGGSRASSQPVGLQSMSAYNFGSECLLGAKQAHARPLSTRTRSSLTTIYLACCVHIPSRRSTGCPVSWRSSSMPTSTGHALWNPSKWIISSFGMKRHSARGKCMSPMLANQF